MKTNLKTEDKCRGMHSTRMLGQQVFCTKCGMRYFEGLWIINKLNIVKSKLEPKWCIYCLGLGDKRGKKCPHCNGTGREILKV